jgi:hypothetical protein
MQYLIDHYTEKIKLLDSTNPNYFDGLEDKVKTLFINVDKRLNKRINDFRNDFKSLDVNSIELANNYFEVLLDSHFNAIALKQQLGIGMHTYILIPYNEQFVFLIDDLKKYLINWYITYAEAVEIDEFLLKLELYYENQMFYYSQINEENASHMNHLNKEPKPNWELITKLIFDINTSNMDGFKEMDMDLSKLMDNISVRLLSKGLSRGYKDNSPYITNFKDTVQELYNAFNKNSLIDIEFDQFLILLTANSENIPLNQKIFLDSTRLNVPNKVIGMILSDFRNHFNREYNFIDFIQKVFIWKKADGTYFDFTKRKQLSNLIKTA